MKKTLILIMGITLMVACKGPIGPVGPIGPEGLQGPIGPAGEDFSYFHGSATIKADGTAAIALPVGAGTATQAPLINCYIGYSGSWLLLGTDTEGATAGIVWSTNHYIAVVQGAPPGWTFWVEAAW